ncbi:serine-threonine kinase receptor-associated protein-like [Xenia sp. Carnegie-2017]|uniref:serine-threonine kinase receptor-associated protein-like n=1 Tax=Xenia sp. Carnegie-2017 TaxID=2897299 RepID=UPI001F04297D|nr:serine-threonine kinase receptor-associated protein-like [Xenia sp. Carnegie-2017]
MTRQLSLTCSGHTRPVVHLSFSDNTSYGYFLISACKDGKPMLRQGETGDWIGTFEGHKGAVWEATLNNDASKAATAGADFTAKVWNAISGEELVTLQHKHIVKTVDFSEDSTQLLTGSNEKVLRLFDLNNTNSDPDFLHGHKGNIKSAVLHSSEQKIFSGGDDKIMRFWDVRTMKEFKTLETGHSVSSMEISRDGSILVVTYGNEVSFWNTSSCEKIKSFECPCDMYSASLHPDKSCFVAGGEDFRLFKFDYETGKELESYKGHFGPVHCVRFSPDGELYASGSEDGTLRLWQNTVGKTYGLWKSLNAEERNGNENGKV